MMRRTRNRGFTLVELMIVVAIIAVLATLAVYGVNKYVMAAKSSEAVEMIQSIKTAQESYKDETFTYLKLSDDLNDLFPIAKAELGNTKVQWPTTGEAGKKWRELGVGASGPVQFGYACITGASGVAPEGVPSELNYPAEPAAAWYVVKAMGDRDDDDEYAVFIGSSFTDQIYSDNDTE